MASFHVFSTTDHESQGNAPTPLALYEKEEKKKLYIVYNTVKYFTGRKAYD